MDGQTQEPMRGSNCVVVSCYIKHPSGTVMSGSASSPIALFLFTSHFFHKVLEGNVLLPVWSVRSKHAHLPESCLCMSRTYLPGIQWRLRDHQKGLSNCFKLSRYSALNRGHRIMYWSYSSGWAMAPIQLNHVVLWLSDGYFFRCTNPQPWAFTALSFPFSILVLTEKAMLLDIHSYLSVFFENVSLFALLRTRLALYMHGSVGKPPLRFKLSIKSHEKLKILF